MRARWKLLGGTSAVAIVLAVAIVGRSPVVSGDPSQAAPTPPGAGIPADQVRNPFEPYEPGSSGIPYEALSASERAGLDTIQEVIETSQPESSYQAFSSAVSWTSAHTESQLAARAVGLEGAEQDGVVP